MPAPKEFLNPNSMLTPGLAGGLTMGITNTVAGQFSLAAPWPSVLALGVSFLVGLIALSDKELSVLRRTVLYVLNSLVIFVVATGSNELGMSASAGTPQGGNHAQAPAGSSLFPSATAQPQPAQGWCCAGDHVVVSSEEECRRFNGRFFRDEQTARKSCVKPTQVQPTQPKDGFFRPWMREKEGG
jgi:hypothetical protein